MVRIMLMYYVNLYTFLEEPDKDWSKLVAEAESPPKELLLFGYRGFPDKTNPRKAKPLTPPASKSPYPHI